jgi:hypothetical protein
MNSLLLKGNPGNPHKYALVYRPHTIIPSGKNRDLMASGGVGVEYGNDRIFAITGPEKSPMENET